MMLPSEVLRKKEMSALSPWGMAEKRLEKVAQKAFFFLTEPTSSRLAFLWSLFMALLVLMIAAFYVLQTVDGPNHYTGRENAASYQGLPDAATYRTIDIVLWTPLVVDTFFRLLMVIAVFTLPGSYEVADDFDDDIFKKFLHLFDFLSVIPFILNMVFEDFVNNKDINQFLALLLRAFYLLSCSKILRITKDLTAVLAVRLALGKSMRHLIIPLFFFLVFNIFFGVFLYFLEPCYNLEMCPWNNLFQACFFSVVTMTTTGYGNQVPKYLPARGVASVIMLFGSLFMSMPLAIIGNEYENAWVELRERMRIDALEQLANEVHTRMEVEANKREPECDSGHVQRTTITEDENNFLKRRKMLRQSLSTQVVDEAATKLANETLMSPLVDSTENLTRVLGDLKKVLDCSKKMNPSLLLLMCELKGWMAPVQWNIQQCMKELASNDHVEDEGASKRLSFFRAANGFADASHDHEENSGGNAADLGDRSYSLPSSRLNRALPVFHAGKVVAAPNEHKAGQERKSNVDSEDSCGTMKSDGLQSPLPPEKNRREKRPPVSAFIASLTGAKTTAVTPLKSSGRPEHDGDEDDEQEAETIAPLPGGAGGAGVGSSNEKKGTVGLNAAVNARLSLSRGQSFAIRMVRAAPDIANKGDMINDKDFARKMARALDNPDSFRTRIWIILEFPHSSKGARALQVFLMCLILMSVLMLYTQTVPSFGSYGESTDICGEVLQAYCPSKFDNTLDEGCFAHDDLGVTSDRLRYDCDDSDCFGHGYNFGAEHSNVSCLASEPPFETSYELAANFRLPDFMVSRSEMHELHDVCQRIECTFVEGGVNGNFVWIPVEIFVSFCFSLEIISRIYVADSIYHFCWDFLNIFDILAVIPFYIDISQAYFNNVPLDFRILSSSPAPVLLVAMKSFKVFRLFKMTRHFSASQVLFETANKAVSQIVGIMALLLFIVLMFAMFLYEVEKGTPCYVGEPGCDLPEDNVNEYRTGQRVLINKVGDVSSFKTVLESLWFSIVTLTSVGYGDLTPITNLGQLISIFLMLFGAIYLAMPLTVAAATFWSVHQAYMEGKEKKLISEKKLVSVTFTRKIRALEKSFVNVTKQLKEFFDDIQAQQGPEQRQGKLSLLQRCLQVQSSLNVALKKHDGDIRRLSAFTISNKSQQLLQQANK